jgi:hypothetical protein
MERILSDVMLMVFMAMIFAGTSIVTLGYTNQLGLEQDVVSQQLEGNTVIQDSLSWKYDAAVISYAELCSRMMRVLDYDVEIDGTFISAETYNFHTFDFSILQPGHQYQVSYKYASDGSISVVCYQNVSSPSQQ